MSPVSRFLIFPGVCAKRSQIDSPLPSSFHAPSIWYEAVAVPQEKFLGNEISDAVANCRAGFVTFAAEASGFPALDETLQAEKSPAGTAAVTAAHEADCRNFRRDRRNMDLTRDSVTFYRDTPQAPRFWELQFEALQILAERLAEVLAFERELVRGFKESQFVPCVVAT